MYQRCVASIPNLIMTGWFCRKIGTRLLQNAFGIWLRLFYFYLWVSWISISTRRVQLRMIVTTFVLIIIMWNPVPRIGSDDILILTTKWSRSSNHTLSILKDYFYPTWKLALCSHPCLSPFLSSFYNYMKLNSTISPQMNGTMWLRHSTFLKWCLLHLALNISVKLMPSHVYKHNW